MPYGVRGYRVQEHLVFRRDPGLRPTEIYDIRNKVTGKVHVHLVGVSFPGEGA